MALYGNQSRNNRGSRAKNSSRGRGNFGLKEHKKTLCIQGISRTRYYFSWYDYEDNGSSYDIKEGNIINGLKMLKAELDKVPENDIEARERMVLYIPSNFAYFVNGKVADIVRLGKDSNGDFVDEKELKLIEDIMEQAMRKWKNVTLQSFMWQTNDDKDVIVDWKEELFDQYGNGEIDATCGIDLEEPVTISDKEKALKEVEAKIELLKAQLGEDTVNAILNKEAGA